MQLISTSFFYLPLHHRVPCHVVWNFSGCGCLLHVLFAKNPLLYLIVLLNKVEYRVLWIHVVL
jgi:hypothetical protein